jgi:hypothetical protein
LGANDGKLEMFKNLKIRGQIGLGFGLILTVTIVLSIPVL